MAFKNENKAAFVNQMDNFTKRDKASKFGLSKAEDVLEKYTSISDISIYSQSFINRHDVDEQAINSNHANLEKELKPKKGVSFRNNPTGIPIKDGLGYTEKQYRASDNKHKINRNLPGSESEVQNAGNVYETSYSIHGTSVNSFRNPEESYVEGRDNLGNTLYEKSFNDFSLKETGNTKTLIEQGVILKSKEHREKNSFKERTGNFLDRAERAFEVIKPEENEAAASNIDDKAIIATTLIKEKFNNQIAEYQEIYKSNKKKIKQLEKKNRETQNASVWGKIKFNQSNTDFKDMDDSFADKYYKFFRSENLNSFGEEYFIPDSDDKADLGYIALASKVNGETIKGDARFDDKGSFEKKNRLYEKEQLSDSGQYISEQGNLKFSSTTISSENNKEKKSVSSYFSDSDTKGTKQNKDKREQLKTENKLLKQNKKKALKHSAAVAAVSNMLRYKKHMQNNLGNMSGEVSGDLIKDGSRGILSSISEGIRYFWFDKIRGTLIKAGAAALSFLMSIISTFGPLIILIVIVITLLTSFLTVFMDSFGISGGNGITYTSLSADEIDEIIDNLYMAYPYEMNGVQESLLRYSLSKVGCEYNQDYHWRNDYDIFDCSSLVYRSYREIGIDISNNGNYSAAEECRAAYDNGHTVFTSLIPGDLIFYGNSDNGRYMGVYHVAIYVGDGKMVEARGRTSGVVYGDVRTNNVVGYARYV